MVSKYAATSNIKNLPICYCQGLAIFLCVTDNAFRCVVDDGRAGFISVQWLQTILWKHVLSGEGSEMQLLTVWDQKFSLRARPRPMCPILVPQEEFLREPCFPQSSLKTYSFQCASIAIISDRCAPRSLPVPSPTKMFFMFCYLSALQKANSLLYVLGHLRQVRSSKTNLCEFFQCPAPSKCVRIKLFRSRNHPG